MAGRVFHVGCEEGDGDAMKLREATTDDLPDLHALIESAYRGETARAGWSHEADLLEGERTDQAELGAMLANPAQHLLLFHDGERPACCVALSEKDRGLVYLGLLTVDPARQASGLGRMMLAATEDHARSDLGARRIEMTVIRLRTELIAWYERRGYAATGERRPFPIEGHDELEFVVLEKSLL
jgi:ribosomal protein S18 acetylase RimI-like enzyme